MNAPSPELCNLWLARAFNAHDVDAAVAMDHPDALIVQVEPNASRSGSPLRRAGRVGTSRCLLAGYRADSVRFEDFR